MTKEERAELRALAEKATCGPWIGDEFEMVAPNAHVLTPGNKKLVWADDYHMNEWDAQYIAAANPSVILELLDENDRLKDIEYIKDLALKQIIEERDHAIEVAKISIRKLAIAEKALEDILTQTVFTREAHGHIKFAEEALAKVRGGKE